MNYPYYYLVIFFFIIPLHAMESNALALRGDLYIDGPVAYGPVQYYHYLNKCNIPATVYEPLIKVAVFIENAREKVQWTNNNRGLVERNGLGCFTSVQVPPIIKNFEINSYLIKHPAGDISEKKVEKKISRKFFPSYIPLHLFTKMEEGSVIEIPIYRYKISLKCVKNPGNIHTSFERSLGNRLAKFIESPEYFKWYKDDEVSETSYTPVLILMEKNLLESQQQLVETRNILRLCHRDISLCFRCCIDPHSYTHGKKGRAMVEVLKKEFKDTLQPL